MQEIGRGEGGGGSGGSGGNVMTLALSSTHPSPQTPVQISAEDENDLHFYTPSVGRRSKCKFSCGWVSMQEESLKVPRLRPPRVNMKLTGFIPANRVPSVGAT